VQQSDPGGADAFPSLTYGKSRASTGWVELQNGSRVAIDQGLEWDGIKVYLSLTWDLVAIDAATNKTVWSHHVSAFWNRLAIRQVDSSPGRGPEKKVIAVELRPYTDREGADQQVERYALRSGEKLDVPVPIPSGRKIEIRSFHGPMSRIGEPFKLMVGTRSGAKTLLREMFGDEAPIDFGKVDFDREVVLVVSAGDSWNCNGFVPGAVYQDASRLLVRYDGLYYQTAAFGFGGDGDETDEEIGRSRPYGMFVLPRIEGLYVAEKDVQNLIGGPSIWKERYRRTGVPAPEQELADLPRDV